MAYDAFLKLGDIKGESTDVNHKEWIKLDSFSWGVTNSGGTVGGGGSTGKASFQDVHFTSSTQKSSPLVAKACATGEHIPKCELSFIKGESQQGFEFLKFEFQDVLVSSYQIGGSSGGEDRPTDAFSLSFVKIELDYVPQNADGSAGAPVSFVFDVRQSA